MERPDILLVNPPYRSKLHIYMPMGLGYVATALDAAGFKVKIHDMNVLGTKPKDVSDIIKKTSAHVVGITGFITQVGHITKLVNYIKSDNPYVKVIVGGSLLNGVEKYLFEESKVDIVIRGEGEEIAVNLLRAILNGVPIPLLNGVCYRDGGSIIDNPGKGYIKDLDSLPMLNRDLFEVEKYIEHYYHSSVKTRTLEVTWSRGCPYKCVYCINSHSDGGYRVRSADKVFEEVKYLKERYKITDFVLASEVFTVNKKKAVDFCNKVAPLDVTWSCFTRTDLLNDEMLAAMKYGNCRQIFIGIEAADNEMLKKMNKRITIEKIGSAIPIIRKYNIEVRGGLICGLPWETPETMKKARDFCMEHGLIYWPSFSTAYPNTSLYDKVKHLIKDEKKYIRSITNHHNFKSYILNTTDMPKSLLMRLKNRYTAETMAEVMHKQNPHLPKFLIRLGTRISLYFYHLDEVCGVDVHSFMHKILKKIYVAVTFNFLKSSEKDLKQTS